MGSRISALAMLFAYLESDKTARASITRTEGGSYVPFLSCKGIVSPWPPLIDPFHQIAKIGSQRNTLQKATKGEEAHSEDLFMEMEPKIRQQIRIVGRSIFCFKCEGSKELASYYCACGSFLCALHLAMHTCLVSSSLQYNEELLQSLS